MNGAGQIDEGPGQADGPERRLECHEACLDGGVVWKVVGVSTERAVRDRGQNSMNTRLRLTIILNTRITATETSPPAIVP